MKAKTDDRPFAAVCTSWPEGTDQPAEIRCWFKSTAVKVANDLTADQYGVQWKAVDRRVNVPMRPAPPMQR